MSLEDQYDAWVRGLMGGSRYTANPQAAQATSDAMQEMQAQLDALTAAQKRQKSAAAAVDAVQKVGRETAEHVRQMSSELTQSLKQDGLLGGTVAAPAPKPTATDRADFSGVADKVKAQVLGQDAFVTAVVKAFRRPFVLGTAADTDHAKKLMLLCGPPLCPALCGGGTGRPGHSAQRFHRNAGPFPLSRSSPGKTVFAGPVRGAAIRRRGTGL